MSKKDDSSKSSTSSSLDSLLASLDSDKALKSEAQKSGHIAIVGRPNVGKSTLLNHLLEQKISITSRKPQTTRNNVLGIKTRGDIQLVFVDTPGIHKGQTKAINRYMNRTASSALKDVDVTVFVVDSDRWTDNDDWVLQQIEQVDCPVILAVNKLDTLNKAHDLLPYLNEITPKLSERLGDRLEVVPISALRGQNLETLENLIISFLPHAEHFFPEDQVTDRSLRFLASEIIREKITRQLGAELPHQVAVEIEEFSETPKITTISAVVLVEREGQKRILIGDKGDRMKKIGQQARLDMEKLFSSKVMLNLWVKVKTGWSDDERALRSLGYSD